MSIENENLLDVFIKSLGNPNNLAKELSKFSDKPLSKQTVWNYNLLGQLPRVHLPAFYRVSQEFGMGYTLEELRDAKWEYVKKTAKKAAPVCHKTEQSNSVASQ